jgi:hypothetical protein
MATQDRPRRGSRVERFDDDGLGYGRREGPESQGQFAGEGFGQPAQGDYGDEGYDPSYARGDDAAPPTDAEERPLRGIPAEHEGEGRGQDGTAYAGLESDAAADTGQPAGGDASLARPDASIEEEVRERLSDELDLDVPDLAATVTDGVVVLEGVVETSEARDAVERVTADVAGVRSVENRLRLRVAPEEE